MGKVFKTQSARTRRRKFGVLKTFPIYTNCGQIIQVPNTTGNISRSSLKGMYGVDLPEAALGRGCGWRGYRLHDISISETIYGMLVGSSNRLGEAASLKEG